MASHIDILLFFISMLSATMMSDSCSLPLNPVANRQHRKSKNGCLQCKKRKVKVSISSIGDSPELTDHSAMNEGHYVSIAQNISVTWNSVTLVSTLHPQRSM